MTTDQTKALEILMEIGGNLDYETQFAPLLRFVLSGSVENKKEAKEEIADTVIKIQGDEIEAYCDKCGWSIFCCQSDDTKMIGVLFETVNKAESCPHCHAKFLHE